MSVFTNSVGFGAYTHGFSGTDPAVCDKKSPKYDEDECMFYVPPDSEMTGEEALKMQLQMAREAGMSEEEIEKAGLDPEWARKMLSTNWFGRLPGWQKGLVGLGAVGAVVAIVIAVK